MRKKIRKIIFILAGIFFMGIGLMLLWATFKDYRHDEEFLKFVGVSIFLFGMGFCFTYFSGAIADANEPERVGKTNKYYIRQLLLFFALLMAYMAVAIRTLMKNPSDQTVLLVMVGWVVIIGALIWLIVRSVKQRKTIIQDGFFENVKIHENDSLFSMIVDCCWYEEKKMYLRGTVHGTVHEKDKFYFYFPSENVYSSKVIGIEVEGQRVPSMTDGKATLLIDSKEEIRFPFYTVCSSAIPSAKEGVDHSVSSPRFRGLLEGKMEQWGLPYYGDYLEEAMVHARYLIRVDRSNQKMGAFQKFHDYFFGYFGPFQVRTVSSEEDSVVLAVYTDWQALKIGKEEVEKDKEAMVVSFNDLQKLAQSTLRLPVVINPFSTSLFLSLELLFQITHSESYQKEFGSQEKDMESHV